MQALLEDRSPLPEYTVQLLAELTGASIAGTRAVDACLAERRCVAAIMGALAKQPQEIDPRLTVIIQL